MIPAGGPGHRPRPPAPAYEQIIHGRPWRLLTSDELMYLPRNPRPHKAYGFSPVEQIVTTVNIALRRQAMQLQHFTEGNVPPGLLNAPDGWSPEQIRQFQEWFDSILAGNTGNRTRLVWGPSGAKYQAFKEAPYKDDFDEWLARIVCYAFSLPPTAFTPQVNRATAQTAQDAAWKKGSRPCSGGSSGWSTASFRPGWAMSILNSPGRIAGRQIQRIRQRSSAVM